MRHLFAIVLLLFIPCARAQTTVRLWPGAAPGTGHWAQHEQTITGTPVGTIIINVTEPTLTAYLPDKGKATGAGVIIAPGGAFVALAVGLEGENVARWLQQRGIAAFVLKYRIPEKRGQGIPDDMDMDAAAKYGTQDALRALALVREHAMEWGVAPGKLGILGFSAGAMVASNTALQSDVRTRPDFVALLYGAPFGVMPAIPKALPPIFMAWAQDDPVALPQIERFHMALDAAGMKPEAHIFATGGHGFGMKHQGTSSDHWPEEFRDWLVARKFVPAEPSTP
ncbi:alpha/beta hydrolase [Solilutibacter silvestris]|uniref:Dienelactone hydrolase family protein n=1 Tax=Solilutibacter silvestris TaxID=1645665 RepID=A0A2K1PZU2_9GAMM|nr:alpha/beta hydrolase [Lysobacter silvestris]PNS08311.1 Dienelactone hydrolase family protein [Lysobacter silvestris]